MASPEAMVEEISKLSVEQLRQMKEQVDGEASVLQGSLSNTRTAANRFAKASRALDALSQQSAGKKMLVPLTSSLCASGTLANTDNVLVDAGTGYFIEKICLMGRTTVSGGSNFINPIIKGGWRAD